MKNVLIYNQDAVNTEVLKIFLTQEHYEVFVEETFQSMIHKLSSNEIQMIVMEIDTPQKDGLSQLKAIRSMTRVPVLILSHNEKEQMKIAALNAGADDYVIHPYHPMELMARINCQFKRYTQLANLCDNITRIYRVDELMIDDVIRKVTVGGKEVKLTPIEYKILRLLVQDRGKVFTIDQIYESIWNMRAIGADNTIAVHIRHIREKIEHNPKEPKYLKVVWGTGYKVG